MSYLTKLDLYKMKKDADLLLFSAQAVRVTLRWMLSNDGGAYDKSYQQYDGGTTLIKEEADIPAEKIIVTPAQLAKFDFGIVKVGNVIFRFSRDYDLGNKTELSVISNSISYYPVLFEPDKEDMVNVAIGNTQLFQTLVCTRIKEEQALA